jgi:Carboxypeptidase regulatory-like domain/TonB dependent receptor
MKLFKYLLFVCALFASTTVYSQQTGSLSGQVYDSLGGVLKGAAVAVTGSDGKVKNTVSNGQGEFQVNGLAPGKYSVVVKADKFGDYENQEVEIVAGKKEELSVTMTVQITETAVEVSNAGQVSTEVDENKSSTVLKGTDLDALPDDPDELEAALQALAGPSAGPNGGQFFIDGFAGGRIPPKESIREIRINSNPFSAEFDRLGFGRVEILTRPGSDKFRGQASFNFNDESLNSRNPFAANRASSQTRNYSGGLSGPVQKGKSSFSFDISERQLDNNSIINAKILDSSLNVVNFSKDVVVPTRRFSFSPRFDYQINPSNTLVARYSYGRNSSENQGVGGTSLASRASTNKGTEHEFRLTETAILNAKTVNETRFEYRTTNRDQVGDNTIPTINVFDAFTGGGSQIGLNYTRQKNWELNNFTTTSLGKKAANTIKFGVRVRGVKNENRSESNFGGTFNFAGTPGFYTPTGCNPVPPLPLPVNCVFTPGVDSISQYRQKLLGNTNPIYNPSQFTITTGNPLADVSQIEYGIFITDDWKARPDLTLSFGLRYENQTNISSNKNFAPRFGFAWSPGAGGARQPKMTFRGGAGIFYERFGEGNTLQINRFDGIRQQNYILDAGSNAILSGIVFNANGTVSNVPTAAQLRTLAPQTTSIRTLDPNARAAYTMQTLFSVERSLPKGITIAATYVWARTLNTVRQVNVNAPFCPPLSSPAAACAALKPNLAINANTQYQTNGVVNSQFLNINFRSGFGSKFTFFGNYRFGITKDNADTPLFTYDLSSEYGTSSRDVRHNFVLGGSYTAPWKIRLNPFVILSSATPFNITTGLDNNRDSNFNDRPSFATDLLRPSVRITPFGNFDINPIAGQIIIPKNFGRSTPSYNVNLNMSRSFGFGGKKAPVPATTATTGTAPAGTAPAGTATAGTTGGGAGGGRGGAGGGQGGGGGMMGMPGMGGGRGGFGGGETNQPYNFTVGVNVSNLLNTANLGSRTGNLSSRFFGQATSTGGAFGFFGGGGGGGGFGGNGSANRRVEIQLRFSF